MDYRTVKAGRLLAAILRGRGFDADSYTLTVKERAQYADLMNGSLRKAWESEFWPQLMLVERRQFRPDWDVAETYAEGQEVYYAAGDAYYRAVQTNVGVTPGTDDTKWVEATDMLCFVAFSQDFGTGSEIDDTGVDYERCAYEDDPLVTPDAVAIRGCKPWQRTILLPTELAVKRPYIRFRPPCPEISFTAWSGSTAYTTGEVAYLDSDANSYVALRPNSNKDPATQNEDWAPVGVPAVFADYLRLAVVAEQQADDEGKYRTLAKAQEELDRLRDRHLPAAGLGGRATFRYARGVAMALAILLAGTAWADGARNPGDYSTPGTRTGTPPAYTAGSNTNPPASRAITVYGSVETNDLLVFADRTGRSVRGTNVIAQVHAIIATGSVAYATAAGNAAQSTGAVAQAAAGAAALYYPRANPSNWVDRAGATQGMQVAGAYLTAEADTNALAQLAAVQATFPSLSVAEARRIVQSNSNAWIAVENGTGVLYVVTVGTNLVMVSQNGLGPDCGMTNGTVLFKVSATKYGGQGNITSEGVFFDAPMRNDWVFRLEGVDGLYSKFEIPTTPAGVYFYENESWGPGTVTLGWQVFSNSYPIATDADTVIKIATHNADSASHPDRPTYDSTTNIVRSIITTNHVAGWLVWDSGSNRFWTVVATNLRFYVTE